MDDLISRQAAIDALNNIEIPRNASWYQYYQQALTAVYKLPPAQSERIKGHWIDAVIPNDSGCLPVIVCDKCNTFFPLQFGASHNFCPNCGAEMEVTT